MKNGKTYRIQKYAVQLVRDGVIVQDSPIMDLPIKVAGLVRDMISLSPKEHFVAVYLNARHKILGISTVSIGTLSASLVHPREVFQPAILLSACALIVAHNHPSGDCSPSQEDIDATKRLSEAGKLLGITLLDHVIVTQADDFYSMQEHGRI